MKNWNNAEIEELNLCETAKQGGGHGNNEGGPDGGGNGNGKKSNMTWTEAQKDGNTTFWGGPTENPVGSDDGYNGVNNLS